MTDDIMIDTGWYVSDIASDEEAEKAFAFLTNACAQIQQDIDFEFAKPKRQQDRQWMAKANAALRYKKAAMALVQIRIGRLRKEERRAAAMSRDRQLLDHIHGKVGSEQFSSWIKEVGLVG